AMETTEIKLEVKNIKRLEEADINEDFYTKLFGAGVVNNEEEFKAKVREEVEGMLEQNAEQKLQNDIYTQGMEKVNVDLPEDFLKRWLKATNPEIGEAELEEGFADFLKNSNGSRMKIRITQTKTLQAK